MDWHRQGGGAFPLAASEHNYPEFGMSLRDWFAGQALAGYFGFTHAEHQNAAHIETAKYLYAMADAMLAARAALQDESRSENCGGKMTTEKDTIARLTAELEAARAQIEHQRMNKDAAYLERNKLVALLAAVFPSGIKRTAIEGWSDDWHGCVYIDFPWGQASWHYHDSHAHLFDHLPPYAGEWDGHTTEAKYAAIVEASRRTGLVRELIGAVLQEAAAAVRAASWPEDGVYDESDQMEKAIQNAERATVEIAVDAILALNPDAMAALDRAKVVKVKPLVWVGDEGAEGFDIIASPDRYHRYTVRHLSPGVFDVILNHELGALWFRQSRGESHSTYHDAKAAAQADYEARIIAALENSHD